LAMLKQDLRTRDIPIIMLTAKADRDVVEQTKKLGAIDYIAKPFSVKSLLTRVKEILNKKIDKNMGLHISRLT